MEMGNLCGRKENLMKEPTKMELDREQANIRFKTAAGMKDSGSMEFSRVKGFFIKAMMRSQAIGSMVNLLNDIHA